MAETSSPTQTNAESGWKAMAQHMLTNKIGAGLWFTRILTFVFTLAYYIPLFPIHPHSAYYKALMANAATSALRLHQRVPSVQFNMTFLVQVLLEDSAHYLFYSIIFLNCEPVTIALLPVVLFAILHSASYTLTLLDLLGHSSGFGARMLISLVELQSRNILRMVALTEIFLLPLTIMYIFLGKVSIFTPILYYRFLSLRYNSRRNPYSKNMFHEIRVSSEVLLNSPRCPQGVRDMGFKMITMISRWAPANHQQ